jgi:hypothetical protein
MLVSGTGFRIFRKKFQIIQCIIIFISFDQKIEKEMTNPRHSLWISKFRRNLQLTREKKIHLFKKKAIFCLLWVILAVRSESAEPFESGVESTTLFLYLFITVVAI